MIVKRLPKADPDIEEAQTTADTAKKTAGHESSQARIGQQEVVIGPLWGPGKDDQKDTRDGADQDEQEHRNAV